MGDSAVAAAQGDRLPLHRVVGGALVALGLCVMAGWLLRIAAVVRLQPGLEPMVFSVALSFSIAGCALLLPRFDSMRSGRAADSLGAALIVIALLGFLQHGAGVGLGIEQRALHAWLPEADPAPGRMSATAAAGFLMAGLGLLIARRIARPGMGAIAVRMLTTGVAAIGVLGAAGYMVNAHLLFPNYLFAGIAFHTAIGMLLLSAGLNSAWQRFEWSRSPLFRREDDRITFVAAVVLVAIGLGAGVATFAILQGRVQTLVQETLLAEQARRAEMFQDFIELRESAARIAATRPAVIRNLRAIEAGKDDGSNIANVRAVVDSFIQQGFSAIAYLDSKGRTVATGGSFTLSAALTVTLSTPGNAELLWEQGFILRHRLKMHDASGIVGEVVGEQPLAALTRLAQKPTGAGDTWDMGLCVRRAARLHCFPQRLNPRAFETPLLNAQGKPLPMTRALGGESGTIITRDYRKQNVVAAYGSVGSLGLGMVTKVDTAEVFLPIRQQLELALVMLLLLVAAGTLLLRARIKPLAGRVVDANIQLDERVKARTQQLGAALNDLRNSEREVRLLNAALEERVRKRTAELEAANKELEAFSYSVSHDLRAPLRHIGGFADLLTEDSEGTLSDKSKGHLGVIRDAVKQMGRLIDDLLAFSKMGRIDLHTEQVDMDALVREAIERVEPSTQGAPVEWSIAPLPAAWGDRATLRQVWVNLLSNAVKYSRGREPIRIDVTCKAGDREFEFRVQDHGAGFDMKYAGKLFGVFQRLHRQDEFEGTGIGLASVRRIVSRHGGRTWAEARVGEGATFFFTLPVAREEEP